jgi:GNAT superfamily N-acetyltransferase
MQIERRLTQELRADERHELLALCALAYDEDLAPYLGWIGDGVHLFVREGAVMVSHLMIVERGLQPADEPVLRTGYVELVATHPEWQGRGYASALLRASVKQLEAFQLGALSPSDAAFYSRLGWEPWRGPLLVRTERGLEPTPEEEIMVYRTSTTPVWLSLDAPLSCEWREGEVW